MIKGKEIFVRGTKWVVGANSSFNFWHDKWLNEGLLKSLLVGLLNQGEEQMKVGEVTQEGIWNIGCYFFVFPCDLLQRIKAIPSLTQNLVWTTLAGLIQPHFDGKNVYNLAKGEINVAEEFTGWWIWKVDMLPKIQCFHMEALSS